MVRARASRTSAESNQVTSSWAMTLSLVRPVLFILPENRSWSDSSTAFTKCVKTTCIKPRCWENSFVERIALSKLS